MDFQNEYKVSILSQPNNPIMYLPKRVRFSLWQNNWFVLAYIVNIIKLLLIAKSKANFGCKDLYFWSHAVSKITKKSSGKHMCYNHTFDTTGYIFIASHTMLFYNNNMIIIIIIMIIIIIIIITITIIITTTTTTTMMMIIIIINVVFQVPTPWSEYSWKEMSSAMFQKSLIVQFVWQV